MLGTKALEQIVVVKTALKNKNAHAILKACNKKSLTPREVLFSDENYG